MLGFLGVLVIVRPGLASFQPAALLVLFAAFGFAISLIATKKLTDRVSTFAHHLLDERDATADGAAWPASGGDRRSFAVRVPARSRLCCPTLALGVAGLSSHYCLTKAFRSGDATVVVPLDFLRIPLIALVGWMFYGETLDVLRVRRRRPDHLRCLVEPARRSRGGPRPPVAAATEKAQSAES